MATVSQQVNIKCAYWQAPRFYDSCRIQQRMSSNTDWVSITYNKTGLWSRLLIRKRSWMILLLFQQVFALHFKGSNWTALWFSASTSDSCRGSSGQTPKSHHGIPGSITGQSVWDLWWTKYSTAGFLQSTSVFPCQYHANSALDSLVYHESYTALATESIVKQHTTRTNSRVPPVLLWK